MELRTIVALSVASAAGLLVSCGSSADTAAITPDQTVTTSAPLRTTLLATGPIPLPVSERPAGVSASARGYDVAGTGGVWIEPDGDAVVVGCSADLDPGPMIRADAIPGYRGTWTCI